MKRLLLKKINKTDLVFITFYLKVINNKEVIFIGETKPFTLQLVKI